MKIIDDKEDFNKNEQVINTSLKLNNADNNNHISLNNAIKLKNYKNTNNRYYQNENEEKAALIIEEDNYISIFNDVVKSIDKIIFQNGKKEQENDDNIIIHQYRKGSFVYDSINEEEIDYNQLASEAYNIIYQLYSENKNILLLKNQFGNNLSQYYISSGLILVSLEIIKIYNKIFLNNIDGEENFLKWLINDNNEGQNVLEIGICIQSNPIEQISFYKQVFEIIEKTNNNKIIYQIMKQRKENILLLCVKEEKLFLLLFLYEIIKKDYPSSNPLNIINKSGLTPLHFSCYYLSREITDVLLTLDCEVNPIDKHGNIPLHFAVKGGDLSITKKLLLYGGNRDKLNSKNLTPIDYANKYGNFAMKNLFTRNPLYKIEKMKNKKQNNLFLFFFCGCFIVKYIIYENCWKYYVFDIFCFFFFLYFLFKKKDYYRNPNIKLPSKDINYETLFAQCNYDKNKIKRICPKCKLIKSLSMKHCMVCDTCVSDFDHHCFWINKCINANINIQFICFLVFLLTDLIINLVWFLIEIKDLIKEKPENKDYLYYFESVLVLVYLSIFCFGICMIGRMLWERIRGKLSSRKKLTLEENLLNKKHLEDECEDEKNKNNNNNIINNNNDIKMKLKEENKNKEIEIKNII